MAKFAVQGLAAEAILKGVNKQEADLGVSSINDFQMLFLSILFRSPVEWVLPFRRV